MSDAKLSPFAAPAWGVGQVAAQIFRDVPSLLLLFYMTQALEIPPALAGIAIFIPKLFWGIVCDLGVGAASDRWAARHGRRIFLLAGAVLAPIAFIALFVPPAAGTAEAKALHVAIVLAFYMAVFAIFSVPHLTIGAELTDDPAKTSTVMAWRVVFQAVGLIIASSVAPILVQAQGGGVEGYQFMSWVLAAICAATLLASFFGSPATSKAADPPGRSAWASILANKPFLTLYGAFLLQLVGAGLAYATWLYLLTFNLAFENPFATVGILGLTIAATVILVQPVWVAITKRIGKRAVFMIGAFLYGLALVLFTLLPQGSLPLAIASGVVMAIGNSACYQSAFAMLADTIEEDRQRTGEAKGGLYSALWVINDKIGFALGGTLIAGLVLQAFGFQQGQGVVQTPEALTGIVVAFAVLPALLNLGAIALMWIGYKPQPASVPAPQAAE